MKQPLVTDQYTADPSVLVVGKTLYLYPSHDRDVDAESNDNGDQYQMEDYHVFSMTDPGVSPVVDHGEILHIKTIPWVSKQLWAPAAARKNGTTYLYFPARDRQGVFRIGVASAPSPTGPFVPEPEPIEGSFSIDPSVLQDDDGKDYMVFGGLWGGQLEHWTTGTYRETKAEIAPEHKAICPKIVQLAANMKQFQGPVRDLEIVDEKGNSLLAGDNERRYFEGPWLHKYRGTYYFSYSTGDTHTICYATSNSVWGPYVFQGRILNPVVGWTTHHAIVCFNEKWYLFYHDSTLSGGISHKRCVKVQELRYTDDGKILTHDA